MATLIAHQCKEIQFENSQEEQKGVGVEGDMRKPIKYFKPATHL